VTVAGLLLGLFVLFASGCGGGGNVAPTTPPVPPQRTASPDEAAQCLNSDQFLVEAGRSTVKGSAPDGLAFTVRFYPSVAEALAAFARLDPLYASAMGSAVIDYHGNPPAHHGGKPMRLVQDDFATLHHCLLPAR